MIQRQTRTGANSFANFQFVIACRFANAIFGDFTLAEVPDVSEQQARLVSPECLSSCAGRAEEGERL